MMKCVSRASCLGHRASFQMQATYLSNICPPLCQSNSPFMYPQLVRHASPFSYEKYLTTKPEVKNWNAENRALFGPKMRATTRARALAGIEEKLAMKRSLQEFQAPPSTIVNKLTELPESLRTEQNVLFGNSIQTGKGDHTSSSSEVKQNQSSVTAAVERKKKTELQELESMLLFPLCPSSEPSSPNSLLSNSSEISVFDQQQHGAYARAYPSVSKILEKTRPPEAEFHLRQWMRKMIDELGQKGFEQYQKELWATGSLYHECVQLAMQGRPRDEITIPEKVQPQWTSVQHVLDECENARLVEGRVRHPALHYGGVLDCLAMYKGRLCVIDWKMSKREKASINSTFDNPLQIAAYMGALNSDDRFKFQVTEGLVVIAYESGQPAHAHHLSPEQCNYYWQQWLHRLHEFWTKVVRGDIKL